MLSHCRVPNLYYTIKLGHPQEGKTPIHLIPVIVNHLHSWNSAAAIELRLSSVCSFLLTPSLSYTFHWGKEKFRFNKILRAVTAKPKEEMCRCISDSDRGRSFLATSTQNLHFFFPPSCLSECACVYSLQGTNLCPLFDTAVTWK